MAGELDKFSSKGVAGRSSTSLVPGPSQVPDWAQKTSPNGSKAAEAILRGTTARFAIALDATGSMATLIDTAKQSITEIMKRVVSGAGRQVEIMLVAYRDYDVARDPVEISVTTNDANELIFWLSRIVAKGGGANDGEAIECALAAIKKAGRFDAILLAGDEPPNSRANIREGSGNDGLHAEDIARYFGQDNTPIHTFVVGQDPRTVTQFAKLSFLSGGRSGKLDGSQEMIDMAVMAMLAKLKGSAAVRTYIKDFHVTSRAATEFGNLLLEGPKK
ncbi:hypothetical protein ACQR0V_25475 [Bradyrhizobium sp. HKCCYLS2058]|uniref:hypothetical protein n=1 Tax=unclassified Bradyrhizobium TaxID=2631580 RepID=UPI003EBC77C0